jgi:hypothetical protein
MIRATFAQEKTGLKHSRSRMLRGANANVARMHGYYFYGQLATGIKIPVANIATFSFYHHI